MGFNTPPAFATVANPYFLQRLYCPPIGNGLRGFLEENKHKLKLKQAQ